MKKRLSCLTYIAAVVLIFCTQSISAYADLIWEPEGDFYSRHYDECEYVGKSYRTNGREGYVTVYEEPGSAKEVAKIKNGKSFYIGFSYEDNEGITWAVVDLWGYEPEADESLKENCKDGWVAMENLAKIYGEGDFRAEHSDEFQEYGGEMDDYEIENSLIFWTYPGSGVVHDEMTADFPAEGKPDYQYIYTDADGFRWSYVGYYYGCRGWICVDDAENENLMTSYAPGEIKQKLYPAKAPEETQQENVLNSAGGEVGIAVISVLAVMLITAALIVLIFGKKKDKEEDKE